MCESKELIVGFLYDELTSGERQEFQAHLVACSECDVELEALRSTRTHLALWSPPQPDLGFRMISGGSAPIEALPRPRRLRSAFAFAAAAAMVLAAAAAIANLEIRYDRDGLMVRTGWADRIQTPPQGTGAADLRPAGSSFQPAYATELAELDRRVRSIEASVPNGSPGLQLAAHQMRMSDAELLRQVRQMLNEAQSRQQTALNTQMVQIVRDFEQQRLSDVASIQQGLEQYQGMTNAEIAQNRDMFNQLIRASVRQEK